MPVSQSNPEDISPVPQHPPKASFGMVIGRYIFFAIVLCIVGLLVMLSHPDPSAYKPETMPDKGKNLLEMLFK